MDREGRIRDRIVWYGSGFGTVLARTSDLSGDGVGDVLVGYEYQGVAGTVAIEESERRCGPRRWHDRWRWH